MGASDRRRSGEMETTENKHQPRMPFKPVTLTILQAYYIATPVFLITELLSGISLRVPIFLSTPLRCFYYACCFAFGAVCYLRPRATPAVAFIESSVNIVVIFVGFGAAMIKAAYNVAETTTVPEFLGIKGVINFVFVGAVWIISFYQSQAVFLRRFKDKNSL
jgi:hypothetical protein